MDTLQLLSAIEPLSQQGKLPAEVTGIEADSRKVERGYMFVAVRGSQVDGHEFIPIAISSGATLIVCEELPSELHEGVAYVQVADSAAALGYLASRWYGDPSYSLTLVGVTGTNGKTTTATLLYEMFRLFGEKVGLLSTVRNYIDSESEPATHTRPTR